MECAPEQWKKSQVILLLKPSKPPNKLSRTEQYSFSIVCQRSSKNFFLDHQFGFWNKHSTIDQVHRIINGICKVLEEKKFAVEYF